MNFMEATKLLKEGFAIRRKSWPDYVHLKISIVNDDGENKEVIKGYRQEAVPFLYDASIITSDDWMIVDNAAHEQEIIDFPTAIDMLKWRKKVRLKDWPKSTFLELHPNGKELFMRKICEHPYTPTFECFSSTDWETYE